MSALCLPLVDWLRGWQVEHAGGGVVGLRSAFQRIRFISPSWQSLENSLPKWKTVLPNAAPQCRDIEGYVDPTEPLRDEGPFGDRGQVRSANYSKESASNGP